jgi:signal transduction histidine kinase
MDMTGQLGSRVRAPNHALRFSHAACTASIRYAIVFGSTFAFMLLCMLSASANSAPENKASSSASVVDATHPVAAFDAAAVRARPGGDAGLRGGEAGADRHDALASRESRARQDMVDWTTDYPVAAWYGFSTALLVLMALMVFAFGGWRRTLAQLKRAVERTTSIEIEWQRLYAAVEARERAAQVISAEQAAAAVVQERDRIYRAMRQFVSGPMSALGSLLSSNGTSLPSDQRLLDGRIQFAVRTWVRTVEDMLAPTPAEPRAVVLDEGFMDLRELIDGVVALFSPTAARKGLHLSVSIDRSVGARILADGTRIGQIVFHMLSRAIQAAELGQITIVVRTESLNAGSQRIFISVRDIGAKDASPARQVQAPHPSTSAAGEPPREPYEENDAALALCRWLAQHMCGELAVSSEPGFGMCSTFSAPFAIEQMRVAATPVRSSDPRPQQAADTPLADSLGGTPIESIDRSYLEALSNEGIDLPTFGRSWRQAVHDDLLLMRGLRDKHDVVGLRASLHRLSGAIGLVGAHDLMEALRCASVAQPEPETHAIEVLARRVEALMTQLDRAIDPHRSNLP